MAFREISSNILGGNIFEMLHEEWALLTAGTENDHNTMTISWGGMGMLWNKPVATVYVRPQRYTFEFTEREERFTLSFFGKGNKRKELALLGAKSGRDGDKIREAGLQVAMLGGAPAFEEATVVLVCRKLYRQRMEENCFIDKTPAAQHYPEKDFHWIYVAEIEKVYLQA